MGYVIGTDWRGRNDDTYHWIQRRVGDVSQPEFQRLGKSHILGSRHKSMAVNHGVSQLQDLGGQTSIRPYWRCYYANTAAVIFVIDSTDIERLGTAADELATMLNEEELRDANLLVFANKQDQPGAKGAGEISEALKLGELRDRNWSIVACSAIDGKGLDEGMDWLVVSLFPLSLYRV